MRREHAELRGRNNFTTDDILLEIQVSNILNNIGILPNLKGYVYLREGIILTVKNGRLNRITDDVYEVLAEKYQKSINSIERDIRYSISKTLRKHPDKILNSGFFSSDVKISNFTFISCISEHILHQNNN